MKEDLFIYLFFLKTAYKKFYLTNADKDCARPSEAHSRQNRVTLNQASQASPGNPL